VHKQTLKRCSKMSALERKADIDDANPDVCF